MSLDHFRSQIDLIDEQISDLLVKRFALVLALKNFKPTLTDLTREREILSHLPTVYIQKIYQEIFCQSKQCLIDQDVYSTRPQTWI